MICIVVYMEEKTPKWSEVRIRKTLEREFFLMFVLIRGPQRREYLSRYFITIFQVFSVGPLINICHVIEWMNVLVRKKSNKMYSKGIVPKDKKATGNLLSMYEAKNDKEKIK